MQGDRRKAGASARSVRSARQIRSEAARSGPRVCADLDSRHSQRLRHCVQARREARLGRSPRCTVGDGEVHEPEQTDHAGLGPGKVLLQSTPRTSL